MKVYIGREEQLHSFFSSELDESR